MQRSCRNLFALFSIFAEYVLSGVRRFELQNFEKPYHRKVFLSQNVQSCWLCYQEQWAPVKINVGQPDLKFRKKLFQKVSKLSLYIDFYMLLKIGEMLCNSLKALHRHILNKAESYNLSNVITATAQKVYYQIFVFFDNFHKYIIRLSVFFG